MTTASSPDLIRDYLTPMGYEVELRHNGPDGLAEALATPYEAVILDVMMPGMDGFAVLRELRKKSDVPVLMLTALGEEADRIVGLEIGADDYLPKTFSSRELLARLRAVTRRARIRCGQRRTQRTLLPGRSGFARKPTPRCSATSRSI